MMRHVVRTKIIGIALAFLAMSGACLAQPGPGIPLDQGIEDAFAAGIAAYEGADFEEALKRFETIYMARSISRRTTAAMLMGGKSLLAVGRYDDAKVLAERLVRVFPESRYVRDARAVSQTAEVGGEDGAGVPQTVVSLGVILPISDGGRFTRALLNGVRLAVQEHNDSNPRYPTRIVFRDTKAEEETASDIVETMAAEEDVIAFVGPLYSEEAAAAARASERVGKPMLVPLATDESVSDMSNYVFQANPTYRMRGTLMARFAVNRLQMKRLGMIVESESYAERSAMAFQEEAERLGATMTFVQTINDTEEWFTLADSLDAEILTNTDAIYAPVTGNRSASLIQLLAESVNRVDKEVRFLGNSEWADLPEKSLFATHQTVFPDVMTLNTDSPIAEAFKDRYVSLVGAEPDDQAYQGYDVARYLLSVLEEFGPNDLRDGLAKAGVFGGLFQTIDFSEGSVNAALRFREYRDEEIIDLN